MESRNDKAAIREAMDEGCGRCDSQESPIGLSKENSTPLLAPAPSMNDSVQAASCPSSSGKHDPAPPFRRSVRPAPRRRARLLSNRYLNTQQELINVLKELIKEVRCGNELKKEYLDILRGARGDRNRIE